MLKIENVIKRYSLFELNIKRIELSNKGFFFLKGKSGSGKTTLFNIISGLDKNYEGTVLFNNSKIKSKDLFYINQTVNLLNNLTVLDNIKLKNKKIENDQISEIANLLDINSILDKYPTECSQGQLQRAMVLSAYLSNCKIILADEVTSGLDIINAEKVYDLLKKKSNEAIVIFTSHKDINEFNLEKIINIEDGIIKEFTHEETNEDKIIQTSCNINPFKLSLKMLKGNKAIYICSLCINIILFGLLLSLFFIYSCPLPKYMNNKIDNMTSEQFSNYGIFNDQLYSIYLENDNNNNQINVFPFDKTKNNYYLKYGTYSNNGITETLANKLIKENYFAVSSIEEIIGKELILKADNDLNKDNKYSFKIDCIYGLNKSSKNNKYFDIYSKGYYDPNYEYDQDHSDSMEDYRFRYAIILNHNSYSDFKNNCTKTKFCINTTLYANKRLNYSFEGYATVGNVEEDNCLVPMKYFAEHIRYLVPYRTSVPPSAFEIYPNLKNYIENIHCADDIFYYIKKDLWLNDKHDDVNLICANIYKEYAEENFYLIYRENSFKIHFTEDYDYIMFSNKDLDKINDKRGLYIFDKNEIGMYADKYIYEKNSECKYDYYANVYDAINSDYYLALAQKARVYSLDVILHIIVIVSLITLNLAFQYYLHKKNRITYNNLFLFGYNSFDVKIVKCFGYSLIIFISLVLGFLFSYLIGDLFFSLITGFYDWSIPYQINIKPILYIILSIIVFILITNIKIEKYKKEY